jgi:hypothetical protein
MFGDTPKPAPVLDLRLLLVTLSKKYSDIAGVFVVSNDIRGLLALHSRK